jgi:signal transduction histidine kinase
LVPDGSLDTDKKTSAKGNEASVKKKKETLADPEQDVAPHGTPEEPRMRLLREKSEIEDVYLNMVNEAQNEILLLLPSANAYIRETQIGVTDALRSAARDRNVIVSILTPDPSRKEEVGKFVHESILKTGGLITVRNIREATVPHTVTILVVDRSSSLIIEEERPNEQEFAKAIGLATYSARGSTVKSNIRFFERMWEEVEDREREQVLLEKERRSRREAELLQDILAHDLRNFFQIIISNAELMREEADTASSQERLRAISDILDASERSSQLIERAKKLGKIISQEFNLQPVSLSDSLRRSISLVCKVQSVDQIDLDIPTSKNVSVLADDLLDEVFVNVLSNAVKYGSSYRAPIKVQVQEIEERANADQAQKGRKHGAQKYWKVSVIDSGKGIPDEMKNKVFTRYLDRARGSGLGLSIVHALVVNRYGGMVVVRNRVEGNYREGTVVEVSLKKGSERIP